MSKQKRTPDGAPVASEGDTQLPEELLAESALLNDGLLDETEPASSVSSPRQSVLRQTQRSAVEGPVLEKAREPTAVEGLPMNMALDEPEALDSSLTTTPLSKYKKRQTALVPSLPAGDADSDTKTKERQTRSETAATSKSKNASKARSTDSSNNAPLPDEDPMSLTAQKEITYYQQVKRELAHYLVKRQILVDRLRNILVMEKTRSPVKSRPSEVGSQRPHHQRSAKGLERSSLSMPIMPTKGKALEARTRAFSRKRVAPRPALMQPSIPKVTPPLKAVHLYKGSTFTSLSTPLRRTPSRPMEKTDRDFRARAARPAARLKTGFPEDKGRRFAKLTQRPSASDDFRLRQEIPSSKSGRQKAVGIEVSTSVKPRQAHCMLLSKSTAKPLMRRGFERFAMVL
jgi:hypothetical protein